LRLAAVSDVTHLRAVHLKLAEGLDERERTERMREPIGKVLRG
jgi:ribonuclease D